MISRVRFAALLAFLVAASLVISACALQHRALQILTVTDPHNNDVLPLHQQLTVRVSVADFTAYDPSGWTSYEYTITDNSDIIAHVGNESVRQRNLWVVENNPLPGAHWIEVTGRAARPDPDYAGVPNNSARLFSPWYSATPVCFWVGPDAPPDFCATRTVAQPVLAATATPSPFPPTAVPVIDSVSAYPSPIYYGDTCPSLSTVTFRAALTLPVGTTADLVDVQAHVSVLIGSTRTDSGSFLVTLQPTQTWDTATGGQIFLGTLALTHAYHDGANNFDPASLAGGAGALLWYADASSHNASLQNAVYLGRTLNQVISLAPCPTASQNNRPHDPNNGPGPSSGTGCEQYGNQLSCNLGGCSWNPQDNSCSVNP